MTLLIAGVLHALSLLGQERPVKAADMHYALRLHYPRPLPHCIPPQHHSQLRALIANAHFAARNRGVFLSAKRGSFPPYPPCLSATRAPGHRGGVKARGWGGVALPCRPVLPRSAGSSAAGSRDAKAHFSR